MMWLYECVIHRWLMASLWSAYRMWKSLLLTSPSWPDTSRNSTRFVSKPNQCSMGKSHLPYYILEFPNLCQDFFVLYFRWDLLSFYYPQNCTLFCRSRELEGDGEDQSEQMGNLSCSLMAFTEFNYGAIKNKVMSTIQWTFEKVGLHWY